LPPASAAGRVGVLPFASFIFYGWWGACFVPPRLPILGNYTVGQRLSVVVKKDRARRTRVLLALGVTSIFWCRRDSRTLIEPQLTTLRDFRSDYCLLATSAR
jgi:hypothetical protein